MSGPVVPTQQFAGGSDGDVLGLRHADQRWFPQSLKKLLAFAFGAPSVQVGAPADGEVLTVDVATGGLRFKPAGGGAGNVFSGVSVWSSVHQNLTQNANTTLAWDSEDWTTDATLHNTGVNPSRFIARAAGKWRLTGWLSMKNGGGGNFASYLKNGVGGATVASGNKFTPSFAQPALFLAIDVVIDCALNDYVEMQVYTDAAADLCLGSIGHSHLQWQFEGKGGSFVETVVAKTANYPLLPSDSGTIFTTTGAAGEVDFTLPAWASGLRYSFVCDTAGQVLKIIAPGTDKIRLGGSLSSAGGEIDSSTIGSCVTLVAHAAGYWIALFPPTGAWNVT